MKKRFVICISITLAVFAGTNGASADEPWKAGAASVVITPEKFMWMAGYGGRDKPADGKLTDLWAKALILEDEAGNRGAVITLDLVGIDRELSQKICAQLKQKHGLDRSQIAICTSHTHSGPAVGRNLGPLHYWVVDKAQQNLIDEYAEGLVGKIDDAVSSAIAKLAPSRVQWGTGKSTFAVNRRENKPYDAVPERRDKGVLKGPVDHDVPVLSVRDAEGALKAILFGYACHATVIGLQQWCGDYPGYAQIELEKTHPGAVALFWAGCGGDQNPLPRRTVELAEQYGAELAEAVDEVLAAPMAALPANLDCRYQEIDTALAEVPTREKLEANSKLENRFEVARAKYLIRKMEKQGAIEGNYPYPIGVWNIGGEIDFVTLGGEVVIDYALRLKQERHGINTWVAGYAHDVMAYIPSLRVLNEGGYEGGGSNVYYGLPALWSDQVEETIVGAVHKLAPAK